MSLILILLYNPAHIENQKLGYAMSSYNYLRGTEDDIGRQARMDQEFLNKIEREGPRAPNIRNITSTSDISSD